MLVLSDNRLVLEDGKLGGLEELGLTKGSYRLHAGALVVYMATFLVGSSLCSEVAMAKFLFRY